MRKISLLMALFWAKLLRVPMYHIDVEWCDEDEVFIASSDDIDGLIVEAESLQEMVESLQGVVPALLEANGQIKSRELGKSLDLNVRLSSPLSHLAAPIARPV